MIPVWNKALRVIVLLFPLVVLACVAMNAGLGQHRGDHVWRIAIRGYDPRDLLYGHYLNFRYDWNLTQAWAVKASDPGPHCLCLAAGGDGDLDPHVTPMTCHVSVLKSCTSVIKAWPYQGGYSLNRSAPVAERYLIPEEKAAEIQSMLASGQHKFRMELIARRDGSAAVRGLYVDGEKLEDYLARPPAAAPSE